MKVSGVFARKGEKHSKRESEREGGGGSVKINSINAAGT